MRNIGRPVGLEPRGEEERMAGGSIHMSEVLFYSKYSEKGFRREVV